MLKILAKAMGGTLPPLPAAELDKALKERRQEFDDAVRQTIPQALARLQTEQVMLPKSVELRGIFRFAHRLDSPEQWQEQENRCAEARGRLLAGEDFAKVAAQVSQDATKELGGRLGSRFLDPLKPLDQQLARLRPQGISPVFEVDNGFWCYRLEKKSAGKPMTFSGMPWEAKRILLRQTLHQLMEIDSDRQPLAMLSPLSTDK
ncbi:MAG: peptidylprolyl isomerase [Proteobacteria bacterium]|nr:peptidylprolyl isomerase [Pseudomonadota bacterium]MBU4295507.1 peptidylprolyl isomerase [Pseudomonadota bacterium]MCG2749490.1 peptidylprolyl isomerase [Desulfobulbaceae bacterium]